jgi:hypothetical protein
VNGNPDAGRRITLTLAGLIAVVSMLVVLAISGTREGHAAEAHHNPKSANARSAKQLAFHDGMRKLWEDHITWTRLAIVSFAAELPDFDATAARLLKNQDDIGNAIKPYYGRAAGAALTKLLKEHILGAVTLMRAAKSGDKASIAKASADWYANGNQIADLLHSANPRQWSRAAMRSMMKVHLDETLSEAQNRLEGHYAADVRDYDAVHRHILRMADMLSAGIIHQFPQRFR